MLDKFIDFIIKRHRWVIAFFALIVAIGGYLSSLVEIDMDMTDYLPKDVPSTIALRTYQEEFSDQVANLELAVEDLSLSEALKLKQDLAGLDAVAQIVWLDDFANIAEPLETLPRSLLDNYYRDGVARYSLTLVSNDYSVVLEQIDQMISHPYYRSGQALELAQTTQATYSEIMGILKYAVPLAFAILIWCSNSLFEPVLFMISIFAAVAINMGSNLIFGRISFITQSVAVILQLAVSMDYSIFLLNRFGQYRQEGDDVHTAMHKAMQKSLSAIASSASTTFFGFLALVFMRFLLGPDLGIVLAKGIFFSILTAFCLLPALVIVSYRLIDKTTHKSWLAPKRTTRALARALQKIAPLIIILVLVLPYPLALARRQINFMYGLDPYPQGSPVRRELEYMEDKFIRGQTLLLMVPSGSPDKELALSRELAARPHVTNVISYVDSVGNELPPELLSAEQLSLLDSGKYRRFIIQSDLKDEGEEVFSEVVALRELSASYYGQGTHWLGQPFSLYDMSVVVQEDDVIVNWLSILFIGLVLLINFRSLSLPVLLVFTIKFATWSGLSVIYFMGRPLSYIGYLVISTIQLGATVDYGILMSENYMDCRRHMLPKEAAVEAVSLTLPAIFPPALILSEVAFILFRRSSIAVVADIGLVLCMGALFSFLYVLALLPNLMWILDPVIRYSTLAPGTHKLYRRDFLYPKQDTSRSVTDEKQG